MKKDIIRLITKLLILALPLYLMMGYAYLRPMSFMPIEYTMWQEEKDYCLNGEAVDTIILGDSRAKSGLIPKELSPDGSIYSIAVGGCGPVEMYYALENYLDNHAAPKRAVIIFAPYHFCDIDNWGQTMNSNYLSAAQLAEVYRNAAAFNELDRLSAHPFTDAVSFRLRLPNKYLSSIYNARLNKRALENWAKYDSVREDLGYTEFGSEPGNDGLNYETHHETFDSLKLTVYYYGKLLQLADEKGIEVIIEQSPINTASAQAMHEDFITGYNEMLSELSGAHSSFTVVYPLPVYDNMYFGDNNHLNNSGAKLFTQEIKEKYFSND